MSDSVTSSLSDRVTLQCVADGNPPPNITWTKNGLKLKSRTHSLSSSVRASSIVLPKVMKNDSGTYLCVATNGVGEHDKKTLELTIKPSALMATLSWNTIAVIIGATAGGLWVVVCVGITMYFIKRRREKKDKEKYAFYYKMGRKQGTDEMDIKDGQTNDGPPGKPPKPPTDPYAGINTIRRQAAKKGRNAAYKLAWFNQDEFPALFTTTVFREAYCLYTARAVLSISRDLQKQFRAGEGNVAPAEVAGIGGDLTSGIRLQNPAQTHSRCGPNVIANRRYAKVLYPYRPTEDNELCLEVDDVIEVLEGEDGGWCLGYLRGRIGLFPSNYATFLTASEDCPIRVVGSPPAGNTRETVRISPASFFFSSDRSDPLPRYRLRPIANHPSTMKLEMIYQSMDDIVASPAKCSM
ncbi:hypothetical protein Bbelb_435630 [Branchiostoma belcheri]|nr:hypothetical protein Bbelb_435630 [Branchiostoma belcheri]